MQAETLCSNCGSEFAVGARFCHVCGNEREPEMRISRHARIGEILNFDEICERTGLSAVALVVSIIGVICVVGALLVGVIYSANTVLDWQAVQVWRIQWMLGAIVAFLAAILFNRKKAA
jgi:positive regulator of sigma E activity